MKNMENQEKIEKLASFAHSQWSGWMKYLFSKAEINEDGTWTMPKWAVERWQRQMKTPYSELTDQEKKNDIEEAKGMREVLSNYVEIVCDITIVSESLLILKGSKITKEGKTLEVRCKTKNNKEFVFPIIDNSGSIWKEIIEKNK